jgi:hypothetical protein
MVVLGTVIVWYVRNVRTQSEPAMAIKSGPVPEKQFREEFAMEKETKVVIEKRADASKEAKIERLTAEKVHEEIGDELMPLRSQLETMQNVLNQLQSSGQQSYSMQTSSGQSQQTSDELLQQMQQFSTQAQQQQQKTLQQLQQSIHQATQMLGGVEQSLQSFNMLNQISQQINQSQQQLKQQQQQQQMQQQLQQQVQSQSQQGQSDQGYSSQSYQ